VLVAEVAESSLAYDRGDKAALYARAGFADYWIVNLVDRRIEVHRDPTRGGYRRVVSLTAATTWRRSRRRRRASPRAPSSPDVTSHRGGRVSRRLRLRDHVRAAARAARGDR
jgi:hypothetical protein